MPDAATIAANKTRSQARKLILALRMRGMSNAKIAQALGIEASRIGDIMRGSTLGDAIITPLQTLTAAYAPAVPVADPVQGTTQGAEELEPAPQGSTPAPAFEAPAAEPEPAPSLAERIKAAALGSPKITAPKATSSSPDAKRGATFAEQVTPVAALLIVATATTVIRDPYKPVAPNQAEAAAILRWPIQWLCTELDVAGKLSERSLEILAMLTACGMYGQRAYNTWSNIHAQQPPKARDAVQRAPAGSARQQPGPDVSHAGSAGSRNGAAEADGAPASQPSAHAALFADYLNGSAGDPRW